MQDVCQPTDYMQQPVHKCHARCCCDREQLTEVHTSIMPTVVSQGYTSLFNLLRHCLVRYWFVVYHCLHCALLVADLSQFKPKACLPHKFNAANAESLEPSAQSYQLHGPATAAAPVGLP